MLDRSAIVAKLREISSLLELHKGNRFKVKAIGICERALEASREPIEQLIAGGRLTDIPGIGVALAKQIEELHRTGTSELLASLQQGLPSGVLELSQVAGIGLHALRALSEEGGISSIDDLREAARAGRLRHLKGFGEKKEAKILAAIEKYEQRPAQVRLADGLRLADSLAADLKALPGATDVDLAGALRRSAELAPSIDLVITTTEPRHVARPEYRLPDGTRIRLVTAAPDDRAAVLIHATSDEPHFRALQRRAIERGLELRPTGLREASGASVPVHDERDLYARLGLGLVPAELRDGGAELEEAEAGDIELVTEADVRGFVHCHSTWSDGKHSIEQMARAAEERGASFLTITDHSATAHYAGGLDVDRLKEQWDEIDEVQERVSIRILKGTESDILADGALDWPDDILERFDVVIASIHNRYRQDEAAMMRRLLRAMRLPIFKIWGHPLGRLVPSRPPIPCRVEEVLDALAASEGGGAIEINGDPYRMDLEPRWARAARERGLPFVLSVDAHAMRELDNLRVATALARRAGLRRADVLNARTASAFARAVRPVPRRRAA